MNLPVGSAGELSGKLTLSESKMPSSTSKQTTGKPKGVKTEAKMLELLKQDLIELETYIPWQAVPASWGHKRNAWARKTNESIDINAVGKQLLILENVRSLIGATTI